MLDLPGIKGGDDWGWLPLGCKELTKSTPAWDSWNLPTLPSPNPMLTLTPLIGQNVGLGEGYEGRFTIICIVPQILPRKRACQTPQHIPVPCCKHLWFHHIRVLPSHEHKQYYTKCHTSVMRSLEKTKSQDTRQEHNVRKKKENCNKDLWLQQWSPSIII